MTHQHERIIDYVRKFPDVRNAYVAQIFGVDHQVVNTLRRQNGLFDARKTAAITRKVKPADLDDMILQAVYKRGLVDVVLEKERTTA